MLSSPFIAHTIKIMRQSHFRRLRVGLLAIAFTAVLVLSANMGASAANTPTDNADASSCTLACSTRLRQCSMYAYNEVPRRYIVVKYMPRGYQRVYSSSTCKMTVCGRDKGLCSP